jgi:hypothetical protein
LILVLIFNLERGCARLQNRIIAAASATKFVLSRVRSWLIARVKIITDENCTGYSRCRPSRTPARITTTVEAAEKSDRAAAHVGAPAKLREMTNKFSAPTRPPCSRA